MKIEFKKFYDDLQSISCCLKENYDEIKKNYGDYITDYNINSVKNDLLFIECLIGMGIEPKELTENMIDRVCKIYRDIIYYKTTFTKYLSL